MVIMFFEVEGFVEGNGGRGGDSSRHFDCTIVIKIDVPRRNTRKPQVNCRFCSAGDGCHFEVLALTCSPGFCVSFLLV